MLNLIDEIDTVCAVLRSLPTLLRMEEQVKAAGSTEVHDWIAEFTAASDAIGTRDAVLSACIWRLTVISATLQSQSSRWA